MHAKRAGIFFYYIKNESLLMRNTIDKVVLMYFLILGLKTALSVTFKFKQSHGFEQMISLLTFPFKSDPSVVLETSLVIELYQNLIAPSAKVHSEDVEPASERVCNTSDCQYTFSKGLCDLYNLI